MPQRIHYTSDLATTLEGVLNALSPRGVVVITDSNVLQAVGPLCPLLTAQPCLALDPGEENKDLSHLTAAWDWLEDQHATRDTVVVNIGGGMVTDLGGLAAATFKRGLRMVNVPTTVLGAVDAAVGGKTGINYHGLKNEIGAFAMATDVVVSATPLVTLPRQQVLSGFAEMLKHGLLSSADELHHLLEFDPYPIDPEGWLPRLQTSIEVKQRIVESDPHEHGARRALNLGHTVGHAIESHALSQGHPVPHGYAVAWGLVTECVLSHLRAGFPSSLLYPLASTVRSLYGPPPITCDDYDTLLALMRHDKKSHHGEINCTLLTSPGTPLLDQEIPATELPPALDILRDLIQ